MCQRHEAASRPVEASLDPQTGSVASEQGTAEHQWNPEVRGSRPRHTPAEESVNLRLTHAGIDAGGHHGPVEGCPPATRIRCGIVDRPLQEPLGALVLVEDASSRALLFQRRHLEATLLLSPLRRFVLLVARLTMLLLLLHLHLHEIIDWMSFVEANGLPLTSLMRIDSFLLALDLLLVRAACASCIFFASWLYCSLVGTAGGDVAASSSPAALLHVGCQRFGQHFGTTIQARPIRVAV